MAQLNREIQERIISIPKSDGKTIELNIVKWGRNAPKYDLRMWEGDTALKGLTLNEEELEQLSTALSEKYVTKDTVNSEIKTQNDVSAQPTQRFEFEMLHLGNIDLKDILHKYPSCLKKYGMLQSILRDLYPQNRLEVNLLVNVAACGVSGQMAKLKRIENIHMARFVAALENEFGIREDCAVGAVTAWADALDIPCDYTVRNEKETLGEREEIPHESDAGKSSSDNVHGLDEIAYEDAYISVIYKGAYKFDGLFAQGHRLKFIIENKTSRKMRVEAKYIAINGVVVCNEDLFNAEIPAHKKTIDSVLMYESNLKSIGVTSVADMNEIAIQFEFGSENAKKQRLTSEILLAPCEVEG